MLSTTNKFQKKLVKASQLSKSGARKLQSLRVMNIRTVKSLLATVEGGAIIGRQILRKRNLKSLFNYRN